MLRGVDHPPAAAEPALFRAFPSLAGRVPWMPLGRFPTPVARVEGLVPASVELWIKHDDQSGPVYGGNKVRKLEFLLAEAAARGGWSRSAPSARTTCSPPPSTASRPASPSTPSFFRSR